jgi:hypothetical protein
MRTEQSVATQIFALVIPAFAARADVFTLYQPIRAYTSIERGRDPDVDLLCAHQAFRMEATSATHERCRKLARLTIPTRYSAAALTDARAHLKLAPQKLGGRNRTTCMSNRSPRALGLDQLESR